MPIFINTLNALFQPRVMLALMASVLLSACVSPRTYPIAQRSVIYTQPTKPAAVTAIKPTVPSTAAPATAVRATVVTRPAPAVTTPPLAATAPVVAAPVRSSSPTAASAPTVTALPAIAPTVVITRLGAATKNTDNDPALSASPAPPTRNKSPKAASTSTDLVQRMRSGFALSSRYNARIDQQFARYNGQQKYIDELMSKASRFLFIAVTEAERRGLPTELALLPIIESAYDPSATSRSNAAGLWQFVPDTGRIYGLRQTHWFDARRDPLESTRAAYDYLAKLYDMFGDWDLVLASYNAGPGTISRALEANKARGLGNDYWSLNLSAETMAYVPRFLAVVSMFKDPASANVSIPALPNRPYFRTVAAKGTLDLDTVAALSGVSLDELRTLNAALRRDQLAPEGPFLLHVPSYLDVASELLLVQQSVPSDVRVVNAQGRPEAVVANIGTQVIRANYVDTNSQNYRVRRGDTWFSIARANQLSATQLALANREELSTILEVGRELSVPSPAAAAYQAHLFNTSTSTASRDSTPPSRNDAATQTIQAGNRGL